jgi:subtilisin family serine protease
MGRQRIEKRGRKSRRLPSRVRPIITAARGLFLEPLEPRQLLAADVSTAAFSSLAVDNGNYSATSLLVQLRSCTSESSFTGAKFSGTKLGAEWAIAPGLRQVQLDEGADLAAALEAYRSDPNVLFAEPDYRISLALTPDDPNFNALWGLDNIGQGGGTEDADIDAPEAWDKTTGSAETIVAVIDTGVDYTHPDLAANMWVNDGEVPGNGADDDRNGYIDDVHGYDFANNDGNPLDDHFHGTHVAGTIGAVGNNGIGITGVAWNVKIMALKFLDAGGGGFTSDAIASLDYAVKEGATVSNASWGGGGFSEGLFRALQRASAAGHIFVAAAGNDGWNNDIDPFYPASYGDDRKQNNVDNVIAVAATDVNDQLGWFSNYGVKSVDIAAPGVAIYSTFPTYMTDAMRFDGFSMDYETISGTSMATPHVAGVIALVRSLHPDWTYTQIIEQVLGTVDLLDELPVITGGRINAAASVGNAAPDTRGPRITSTDPAGIVSGTVNHVRLQFSEKVDAATVSIDDIVSFTGPDGPIAVTGVSAVAGSTQQFDVTFAPHDSLGEYSLVVGPNIADLAGNLMDQDLDGTGGEDPDDVYTITFTISDIVGFPSDDVPAPLAWGSQTTSFLTIDQDITISDLNVQLDIWYPYDFDLQIYLKSPNDGPNDEPLILSYENGGMDADYANTIFDDEALIPISDGFAPFAGSYQPEQPLSRFDGENAAGTWELIVQVWFNSGPDGLLWGDGLINSWSLEIGGGGGSPPPPPDPENRAPVAENDEFQGYMNTVVLVESAKLLENDTDADNDPLTIISWGTPSSGSLNIRRDGMNTFTPDDGFTGEVTFEYTITDGKSSDSRDTGIVTINILPPTFPLNNAALPLDVNGDGEVSGIDALNLVNFLNANGPSPIENVARDARPAFFYDVVPDNQIVPLDLLRIFNYLNAQAAGMSTGAASAPTTQKASGNQPATINEQHAAAVDHLFLCDALNQLLQNHRRRSRA